jgi:hypothetical protein
MRLPTKRPVAVSAGFAQVVGIEKGNIRKNENEIGTARTLLRMPH